MTEKPSYEELEGKVKKLEKEALERNRVGGALRESEEEYQNIIENIEEGYFEVDLAGNLTFVNDSMCKIAALSRDEMVGMNNREYTTSKTASKMFQFFNEVYRTGRAARLTDYEIIRKDGNIRVLELSTSLMRDHTGQSIGFRGIVRDISERKLTEEALEESKEKYRKLYEETKRAEEIYRSFIHSSTDAIIIYDMEGKVRYVNSAFTRMFGWTLEEVAGRLIPFLPEAERREAMSINKDLIEDGTPCHGFETQRYTKAGSVLDVSISASRYNDHEGKPAGMLIVLRDITQTRKLQSQLQHAQKMESMGTIASGVAHNFRNVLAGISINSQLIQMKYPDNHHLKEIVERLNNSVKRGAGLVDGLMQFSRKQGFGSFKNLDLTVVIMEICDLIKKSFDKRIEIRVELPESIHVMGNHAGLGQVIMNLCTNAKDAMPNGGKLHISARSKGDQAEIIISDTGCGMDQETMEKCFDPFFTTKDVDKGTGLGLSTSYGTIMEHEGDIHVYSEIGKGTTFKIYFPILLEKDRDGHVAAPEVIRGKGQKILMVDDETQMLEAMKEMIEALGYQVATANNGEEAIKKQAAFQPDVVLMDRNMAGMDGITCGKKIMENDPNAKILILSGYDPGSSQQVDRQAWKWIKDYLTKPVDMIKLSHVLARVLG
ncbi:MAG: PAS domain S-box protein [Desulfobacterales bacterium]|nr:PAS domain S-box protein [Desulfobacterales bacterium]